MSSQSTEASLARPRLRLARLVGDPASLLPQCSILQSHTVFWTLHNVLHCNILDYITLHIALFCNTLYYTTLYYPDVICVLNYTTLYFTALHCTALYCTVHHWTMHCTALHWTILQCSAVRERGKHQYPAADGDPTVPTPHCQDQSPNLPCFIALL